MAEFIKELGTWEHSHHERNNMSIVRNTVTEVVRSKHGSVSLGMYQPTVEAVIEALEDGLNTAVATLIEQGRNLGASEAQVRDILAQAGLIEDEPEDAAPAQDGSLEERFARMEAVVADLSALAADVRRRRLV
jgi:hypothetical protein